MRGLLILNVRSTPTPDAMRRTVIERVMPPPRRRMTVPSKTWMRSRLPSTTLADTLTVSPVARTGRSVRSWSLTISSSTVTGRFLTQTGQPWLRVGVRKGRGLRRRRSIASPREASVLGGQVRSATSRPLDRLLVPPACHGAVVPGSQDGRHIHPAKDGRPGVLGILQQPVGEGLLDGRRVLDRARQEPDDGVDHDQRGQLATCQHIVADRELEVDQRPDPLVDALVAGADEDEMRSGGEVGG